MNISVRRLLLVIVLLSASGGLQLLRGRAETVPHPPKLQGFPQELADWKGFEEPITQDVLDTLGPGDFLSRNYRKQSAPQVNLFIAYFASQRSGDSIHSPKNCLPGSGWMPLNSGRSEIALADGTQLPVTRYVVAKGSERQLVLYWFQSHGKTTSSEYVAKLQLVTDAVRLKRTDGALVRVVTPVPQGEAEEVSVQRAQAFIRQVYPELKGFIPL